MITKIHSASISVSDLDAAIEFYTKTLGWEIRIDAMVGDNYRFITVAPTGGEAEMSLMSGGAEHDPGGQTGITFSVENIDETFKALVAKGVKFVNEKGEPAAAPDVMPWGDKASWLQDPDGNIFYFIGQ
jgi:catechol 2,3-dioxygenase-like lactoylglutathione lyase family enzyme